MMTREEIQGNWTQLKGQIRERWGQITDDELQEAQGNGEQLIGFLEAKTGESRRQIEQFVNSALNEGQNMLERATQSAKGYARAASQAANNNYHALEKGFESGLNEANQLVKSRPAESLAAAFGLGILAGVVVTLLMKSDRA